MLYSTPLLYRSDASAYYAAIRHLPWSAWLDSAGCSRYDILVAQPVITLNTRGMQTALSDVYGTIHTSADPFDLLQQQLGITVTPIADLPFAGGALGYWSYDLARRYQDISPKELDAEEISEMAIGIYDWAVVIDHQEANACLVSHLRYAETEHVLPDILSRLESVAGHEQISASFKISGDIRSNLSYDNYGNAFDKIKDYLQEGDCYQVNLAQRYAAAASGDAFAAYQQLRQLSPAPYSAYLDWPQAQILCASPECFLRVKEGKVETKPIKGTRPRSANAIEDVRLAEELRQHPKDRAENLMIVDLLRNDLGKSCEPGSVHVPKLFQIESYANVHHLVSAVEGKLHKDRSALDVLRDCFPGGSVTGAPKRRAMQIIEQLEPHSRGVYCGSIGYIGFDGNMDTNIAIRTMVNSNGEIRCWAGGGIVADSQCEAEYQETLDKASAMLAVLEVFGGKLVA